MNLQTVKRMGPPREARKRVGRGKGSGLGKNATKGHKGQGHHTSGGRHKLGFEGGQMPLFRRLPKRGFSNFRFRRVFTTINVDRLNSFDDGSTVDIEAIKTKGLVSPEGALLKILGNGDLKKKLNVTADRFTASARKKIEAAGGTVKEIVKPPTKPIRKVRPRPSQKKES